MDRRENARHARRHAMRALEDFEQLREARCAGCGNEDLWHSLSHHLRHAAYRIGLEANRGKQDAAANDY